MIARSLTAAAEQFGRNSSRNSKFADSGTPFTMPIDIVLSNVGPSFSWHAFLQLCHRSDKHLEQARHVMHSAILRLNAHVRTEVSVLSEKMHLLQKSFIFWGPNAMHRCDQAFECIMDMLKVHNTEQRLLCLLEMLDQLMHSFPCLEADTVRTFCPQRDFLRNLCRAPQTVTSRRVEHRLFVCSFVDESAHFRRCASCCRHSSCSISGLAPSGRWPSESTSWHLGSFLRLALLCE